MSEIRAYCACDGGHYPEIVVAVTGPILEELEMGVQVLGDGTPTPFREDGVKGVSEDLMAEAELDEEPYCWEHREYVTWDHDYRPGSTIEREEN